MVAYFDNHTYYCVSKRVEYSSDKSLSYFNSVFASLNLLIYIVICNENVTSDITGKNVSFDKWMWITFYRSNQLWFQDNNIYC